MKTENVERDEGNHTAEGQDQRRRKELVRERLSLLNRRLVAFVKQLLVGGKNPHHRRHLGDQNHPEKRPRSPPVQSARGHKQQNTEDSEVQDDAENQLEGEHASLANAVARALIVVRLTMSIARRFTPKGSIYE